LASDVFVELVGPAEFTNSQFSVAHLANRVIGGALGCCRRGWKRKRAGFGVNGCTGSPLRWWGEAAEFAGVFRRNREAGLVGSRRKGTAPVDWAGKSSQTA